MHINDFSLDSIMDVTNTNTTTLEVTTETIEINATVDEYFHNIIPKIGKKNAQPGQFPYQALWTHNGNVLCGGSIYRLIISRMIFFCNILWNILQIIQHGVAITRSWWPSGLGHMSVYMIAIVQLRQSTFEPAHDLWERDFAKYSEVPNKRVLRLKTLHSLPAGLLGTSEYKNTVTELWIIEFVS